jgi:glutamine amidotransferase
MQLMAEFSEENDTKCLNIIPGNCRRFPKSLKTPQLGWNMVEFIQDSPLTKNVDSGEFFYFLNSYYFDADESSVLGITFYGFGFPSAVQKDNFYAVQFHPEKSGKPGEQLLKNFCELSKCL